MQSTGHVRNNKVGRGWISYLRMGAFHANFGINGRGLSYFSCKSQHVFLTVLYLLVFCDWCLVLYLYDFLHVEVVFQDRDRTIESRATADSASTGGKAAMEEALRRQLDGRSCWLVRMARRLTCFQTKTGQPTTVCSPLKGRDLSARHFGSALQMASNSRAANATVYIVHSLSWVS